MTQIINEADLAAWIKIVTGTQKVSTATIRGGKVAVARTHNGTSSSPPGQVQIARGFVTYPDTKLQEMGSLEPVAIPGKGQTEWSTPAPTGPTLYQVHRYRVRNGRHSGGHLAFLLVMPETTVLAAGHVDSQAAMTACYQHLSSLGLGQDQAQRVIVEAGTRFAREATELAMHAYAALNKNPAATASYLERLTRAKRRDKLSAMDWIKFVPSSEEPSDLTMIVAGAAAFARQQI